MPPHARSVRRRVEADEILRLKAHSVPVCGDRSAPSQVPTRNVITEPWPGQAQWGPRGPHCGRGSGVQPAGRCRCPGPLRPPVHERVDQARDGKDQENSESHHGDDLP